MPIAAAGCPYASFIFRRDICRNPSILELVTLDFCPNLGKIYYKRDIHVVYLSTGRFAELQAVRVEAVV